MRYICTYSVGSVPFDTNTARNHRVEDFNIIQITDTPRLAALQVFNEIPWDSMDHWLVSTGAWVYVASLDASNMHPNGMPIRVNAFRIVPTIQAECEYTKKGDSDG
jgi:hypothetical protein